MSTAFVRETQQPGIDRRRGADTDMLTAGERALLRELLHRLADGAVTDPLPT